MTKEKFLKILKQKKEIREFYDKLQDLLKCDIFENPTFDITYQWLDDIFTEAFTAEGVDYINAYLYDNLDHCELTLYDENYKLIVSIETDEEFWDFVKDYLINE